MKEYFSLLDPKQAGEHGLVVCFIHLFKKLIRAELINFTIQ